MGILVNGESDAGLDPTDRGMAYGDGVFRTLQMTGGRPVSWDRQYRKLHADCAAICLSCPGAALLEDELRRAAEELEDAVGKIIVTRGAGPRGYAPPPNSEVTRVVSVSPLPQYPPSYREIGVKVHRCSLRLSIQPRLAGIKHLNRLENVLARGEWTDHAIAEGLLLDTDGHLIEGVSSNLFLVRNGVLQTPDLSRCGVSGVTRERTIQAALEKKLPVRVVRLHWEDLMHADEAILVNSLIGAWQIRQTDTREWKRGEWTARVRDWLDGPDV